MLEVSGLGDGLQEALPLPILTPEGADGAVGLATVLATLVDPQCISVGWGWSVTNGRLDVTDIGAQLEVACRGGSQKEGDMSEEAGVMPAISDATHDHRGSQWVIAGRMSQMSELSWRYPVRVAEDSLCLNKRDGRS